LLRAEDEREWRYVGTRDELIAAGLAQIGDLPGDPGAPICSHSVHRDGKHLLFSVQSQIAQPRTFWVRIYKPRPARAPDPPSQAQIERQQREDAIKRAIDSGEDFGIIRRDGPFGASWIGKKQDLIGAGVCEERHFPVKPKRTLDGDADGRAGVEHWSTYAIRRGYFRHSVSLDDDARKAGGHDKLTKPREDDPAALSDRCERWLMAMQNVVVDMMSGETYADGSVRYDRATVDKVAAAIDHARQLLQSSMPARPRAIVRQETRVTVAKRDSGFQAFMASTLSPPAKQHGKRSS
jgi:hypothetical protein